jgi:hypothetical protein
MTTIDDARGQELRDLWARSQELRAQSQELFARGQKVFAESHELLAWSQELCFTSRASRVSDADEAGSDYLRYSGPCGGPCQ